MASSYDGYQRLRVLGRGQHGCAVLLREPASGQLVVAKEITLEDHEASDPTRLQNEVRILQALKHRRIVAYIGSFVERRVLTIVMEYAPGGTLADVLTAHAMSGIHFATSTVVRWLTELTSALQHVHSRRILHRDIKTANIFLTDDAEPHVKLGDFGVSRAFSTETNLAETMCGTPYYLSPELVRGTPYAEPSDVWALGVILFELLSLKRPFTAPNGALGALVMSISSGTSDMGALHVCPHPWWLQSLVDRRALLLPEPARRMTLEGLRRELATLQRAAACVQRWHRRMARELAELRLLHQRYSATASPVPPHDDSDDSSRSLEAEHHNSAHVPPALLPPARASSDERVGRATPAARSAQAAGGSGAGALPGSSACVGAGAACAQPGSPFVIAQPSLAFPTPGSPFGQPVYAGLRASNMQPITLSPAGARHVVAPTPTAGCGSPAAGWGSDGPSPAVARPVPASFEVQRTTLASLVQQASKPVGASHSRGRRIIESMWRSRRGDKGDADSVSSSPERGASPGWARPARGASPAARLALSAWTSAAPTQLAGDGARVHVASPLPPTARQAGRPPALPAVSGASDVSAPTLSSPSLMFTVEPADPVFSLASSSHAHDQTALFALEPALGLARGAEARGNGLLGSLARRPAAGAGAEIGSYAAPAQRDGSARESAAGGQPGPEARREAWRERAAPLHFTVQQDDHISPSRLSLDSAD